MGDSGCRACSNSGRGGFGRGSKRDYHVRGLCLAKSAQNVVWISGVALLKGVTLSGQVGGESPRASQKGVDVGLG